MIKSFLKRHTIIFTEHGNLFDILNQALSQIEGNLSYEIIINLKKQAETILSYIPIISENTLLLHLFNEKISKSKLLIIKNKRMVHLTINQKKIKFNSILLLITNSNSAEKYAKLKGRLIRIMNDEFINNKIHTETDKDKIIESIANKEKELLSLKY